MNVFIFTGIYLSVMAIIEKIFKNNKNEKIFLFFLILPIFIISWRRGNTTVDYGNYEYIFMSSSNYSFITGWQGLNVEPGYFWLNKIIRTFTTNFSTFLFCYSMIVLSIYHYVISKYSSYYSLSLLLLVGFGSYYTSFNTMRQYLAATIFILAVINIDKSWKKYILIVLVSGLIHISALVMIPFYYILKLELNKLKDLVLMVVFLIAAFIVFAYTPSLVKLITLFFYQSYSNANAFGIGTGVPFVASTRIIFLFIYALLLYDLINFNNTIERVGFNSIVITLVFMLTSTRVEMFQRFTYFFLPYMILFIPNITQKVREKNLRVTLYMLLIVIVLSYIILTQKNLFFVWS